MPLGPLKTLEVYKFQIQIYLSKIIVAKLGLTVGLSPCKTCWLDRRTKDGEKTFFSFSAPEKLI